MFVFWKTEWNILRGQYTARGWWDSLFLSISFTWLIKSLPFCMILRESTFWSYNFRVLASTQSSFLLPIIQGTLEGSLYIYTSPSPPPTGRFGPSKGQVWWPKASNRRSLGSHGLGLGRTRPWTEFHEYDFVEQMQFKTEE